jgi:hypothetical protein
MSTSPLPLIFMFQAPHSMLTEVDNHLIQPLSLTFSPADETTKHSLKSFLIPGAPSLSPPFALTSFTTPKELLETLTLSRGPQPSWVLVMLNGQLLVEMGKKQASPFPAITYLPLPFVSSPPKTIASSMVLIVLAINLPETLLIFG